MLLIALTLETNFVVPPTQVKAWYGISNDTWASGTTELMKAGLLKSRVGKERNWMKGLAYDHDVEYALTPRFDTRAMPGFTR
ncbi:hypothetical protein NS220_11220 [Microbacterium testaceum]|uniref:Uncharacterized protein n=1 Tax=Microbacterium testaceum TaxID=2033 RepID=A0A147EWB6_MICTE|nr:hypothetical protein NS220_11220 [Microbacterium testaceum]